MSGLSHTLTNLLAHLAAGDRGKLTVSCGPDQVSVFFQEAEIVATAATDDEAAIVRRARIGSWIDLRKARELATRLDMGQSVLDELYDELEPKVIDQLMRDRFYECIVRFISSTSTDAYTPLDAIFTDNFQMGHSSAELLDRATKTARRALGIRLDEELTRGPRRTRSPAEAAITKALGHSSTVRVLIDAAPLEPFTARALVAEMLADGILALDSEAELDEVSVDIELGSEVAQQVAAEMREIAESRRTDDTAAIIDVSDTPTEEISKPEVSSEGAGNLSSYAAWMNHGVEIEAELEAFGDFDSSRGDEGQGNFTTEHHNLDRVEVAPDLSFEDEPIEVGEAPSARFAAPVLSHEDAMGKIDVANGALSTLAAALDQAAGSGRGQSVVQLLVDGSPHQFSELFSGVHVTEGGELRAPDVLRNLNGRPPSEHRHLLNKGLVNLIDRALQLEAIDDLPEEEIDAVLERVLKYRQRLGL